MKKIILSIVVGGSVSFLSSCGSEEVKEVVNAEEEITVDDCTYSVDQESVKVEWTAFKFTEKTAVGGFFEMKELGHVAEAKTPVEAFKEATLSINTRTVNSNNEDRDKKIKGVFFGSMEKTDFLTGKIKSLEGAENGNGKAIIAITMNGVEKDQEFTWIADEENVEFNTELSVENWNAKPSLDSLNTVCDDLHKGEDGISKLWPNIEVKVSAKLTKDCK